MNGRRVDAAVSTFPNDSSPLHGLAHHNIFSKSPSYETSIRMRGQDNTSMAVSTVTAIPPPARLTVSDQAQRDGLEWKAYTTATETLKTAVACGIEPHRMTIGKSISPLLTRPCCKSRG